MNIPFTQSLLVASKVLAKVRTKMRTVKGDNETFYVKPYSNCREQGFTILGDVYPGKPEPIRRFYCAFAENRNSDNIVVYLGYTDAHFILNDDTGIPEEEVYRNGHYFDPGKYDEAAEFITTAMIIFLSNHGYKLEGPNKIYYTAEDKIKQSDRLAEERRLRNLQESEDGQSLLPEDGGHWKDSKKRMVLKKKA